MERSEAEPSLIRFGVFELNAGSGELRKNGIRLKLGEQPLRILLYLTARPGEIVTREELQKLLWVEGTFVDSEHGLNAAINKLRETLNDSASAPRYVETVPRRGYRFVAEVVRPAAPKPVEEAAAPSPSTSVGGSGNHRWWIGAAVLLLLGAVIGAWWGKSRASVRIELALRAITANSGMTTHPVLSPDGKMLAYASDQATSKDLDIWVLPLAKGGQPIRLTNHEAIETDPDFSPDGGLIVYRSERDGGGIYVVPTHGGEERLLVRGGSRPRISPDGGAVAYCLGKSQETQSAIYTIPIGGGTPRRLAADVPWACDPKFTPDGRHIVFDGAAAENDPWHDWWVSPVAGGPSVKTGAVPALAAQLSLAPAMIPMLWDVTGDRGLFSFSGQIWELDLAPPDWKARGPARLLTSGGAHLFPRAGAGSKMVFVNHQTTYRLWKLHVDHNKGRALGEMERLPIGAGSQSAPSSSADGQLLAYWQFEPGGTSIRLRNLVTSQETTLVTARGRPHVSPDGKRVAYSVLPDSLFLLPSSGGESKRLISPEQKLSLQAFGWTPDGRKIVYWYGKPIRYALLDPETLQSVEFLSHPEFGIYTAQISPDQRWVAFNTTDGKQFPLWIAPFRNENAGERNEWIRLRGDLDSRPWWSPDGNLLYTVSQRDGTHCIWAQPLDPVSKRPKGEAFAVLHLHTAKLRVPGPGFAAFGPAIQPDGLIFSLREESSNVWLAEPRNR